MGIRFAVPFLLIWACFAQPLAVHAQDTVDPSDVYLEAYLLLQDALKLEEGGQDAQAHQKLTKASQLFSMVAQTHPDWNPQMLDYRRKKVVEMMTRIGTRMGAGAVSPGVSASPNLPNVVPPPPNYGQSRPLNPPSMGNSLSGMVEQREAEYRRQIADAETENRRLKAQLGQQQQLYQQGLLDSKRLRDTELELRRQLEAKEQLLTQSAAARGEEINALKTEVIMLKRQMVKTGEGLSEANEQTVATIKELDVAKAQIAQLEKAKQEVVDERDQMAVLLQSWERGGDEATKRLMADNRKLQEELKIALKDVDDLTAVDDEKQAQIVQLETQVKEVRNEVAALREERDAYDTRILDLTSRLKETSAVLAGSGDFGALDEALFEENKLLRGVILRQLKQQARMQGTKQLLAEELAKIDGSSSELLARIAEVTDREVLVTPDEKLLFRLPNAKQDGAGVSATLMVEAETKEVEVKPELSGKEILHEAGEKVQAGDLVTAEAYYQKYLENGEGSRAIHTNLGIIRLRLGKYEDAGDSLKEALMNAPDNPRTHYLIGVNHFWAGSGEEAEQAFLSTVTLDEKNSKARHYLGILSAQKGDFDGAKTQFTEALEIDPEYGDAHFNLAVVYVRLPEPAIEKAEEHYLKAVELGADRDPDMENLFTEHEAASVSTPAPAVSSR